jgi:hypothetical protein
MYRNSSRFNVALILDVLVWVTILLGGCVECWFSTFRSSSGLAETRSQREEKE